ncbi:MAG: ABC transporter permease, partial [Chloroflexi bacterium]|nr:ABC transporter permease [Chloroflexota bacterium]
MSDHEPRLEPVAAGATSAGLATGTEPVDHHGATAAERPLSLTRTRRTFLHNRLALTGSGIIGFLILFCFVGPLVYHTDQVSVSLSTAHLAPFTSGHVLGTDQVGRDVLGRLMVGGQTSLEVGVAAAALATLLGTLVGAVAGFFGGVVDSLLMRIVDGFMAVPGLFVVLLLGSMFTPTKGLLILVIAALSWLITARLVRGDTLSLRTREYVEAVRLSGGSGWRAVWRHIIPNAIGTIVVSGTFQVADAILLLASLDFLGLGIPPPAASWGQMLSSGVD